MSEAPHVGAPVVGRTAKRAPLRLRTRVIIGIAVAVVLLVVAVVVADVALRSFAEGKVRDSILQNLPSNVTGDVAVTIGGTSFLQQYLAGSFDDVTLASTNLSVGGVPVAATVVAHGVPTDQAKPVAEAVASLTLSQGAVNSFLTVPGSNEIVLGEGTIGYSGSFDVLGLTLGYDAMATATPSGPDVLLTPTGATLSAGSASIDVGGALKAIVSKPVPICVATYLPERVQLTSIEPSTGQVTVTAEATNLLLSADALNTTGTCNQP
ncbi:hypothetical protein B7R22_09810 [Subtercola boreus]|uniref:DUF2993 domain-containing protein n=1 Tax=Subtercola boreus TaxID=120213 RepID=A0A3E0W0C3_9MICO|nr:DUF2993 domain-containing protein [Subtercola boreus]RFA14507.1 hypothetical protein B7R22_09810 [Subtercola boreus]